MAFSGILVVLNFKLAIDRQDTTLGGKSATFDSTPQDCETPAADLQAPFRKRIRIESELILVGFPDPAREVNNFRGTGERDTDQAQPASIPLGLDVERASREPG